MTRLAFPTYLDVVRSESARFRDVLAATDPGARVPACPDWTAADLLWHLGEVQLFWATVLRTRPAAPADNGIDPPVRPDSHPALLEFFEAASASLVDQLVAADPTEHAWSWAPEQTVGFTFRRQAHEALIHRLDAEQTAGVAVSPIGTGLAADGVAELLEVMYGGDLPDWATFTPGAGLVCVDVTDAEVSFWGRPGHVAGVEPDSGSTYEGPHVMLVADPGTAPDAVVSGTAAAMDTFYWHRSDQAPQVTGDPAVAAAFQSAVSAPLD